MTDTERKLVRNRCKCTHCGDIIESKHRHDFAQCKCGRIFTDGGTAYVRRGSQERGDIEDMSEYEELSLDAVARSFPEKCEGKRIYSQGSRRLGKSQKYREEYRNDRT